MRVSKRGGEIHPVFACENKILYFFFMYDNHYLALPDIHYISPSHLCFWSVRVMLTGDMASYPHWSGTHVLYSQYRKARWRDVKLYLNKIQANTNVVWVRQKSRVQAESDSKEEIKEEFQWDTEKQINTGHQIPTPHTQSRSPGRYITRLIRKLMAIIMVPHDWSGSL